MTTWRVLLSSKKWNQDKYNQNWELFPEVRLLPQSKGGAIMRRLPQKGDKVVFVFKKFIVMRGNIESDGFITGTQHQEHSCNIGNNRPHADVNNEYAWVKIQEIGLSEEIQWMGQKTWQVIED